MEWSQAEEDEGRWKEEGQWSLSGEGSAAAVPEPPHDLTFEVEVPMPIEWCDMSK